MKLTRSKKIIIAVAVIISVLFIFNTITVNAEVNESYMGNDAVTDATLEDAFNDSTLLELLAKLVYAVGQFLEWILGTIFQLLTGTSDFPWADKIVFNAVPLLDVNFINPGRSELASKTFVGQNLIQEVLKNLYSTILAIAVSFFGIVVLITAIKLVISTVASEKAKYKQAIVDWLVGFVLLFCMHYFIAFVFYLNEQLVIVASKIVTANLEVKNAVAEVEASDNAATLIENMGDTVYQGTYKGRSGVKIKDILNENKRILEVYINLDSSDNSNGIHEFLMKEHGSFLISWDTAIAKDEQKQRLATIITWAAQENISVSDLKEIRGKRLYVLQYSWDKGYTQALRHEDLVNIFGSQYGEFQTIHTGTGQGRKYYKDVGNLTESTTSTSQTRALINDDTFLWFAGGADKISNVSWLWTNSNNSFQWDVLLEDLIQLKSASSTNSGTHIEGSGKTNRLISDLASYFKQTAADKTFRSTNTTGLKDTGNINVQNMIMYAILVAQSLILFIAYVKRLFYVVLLAMMAPVVVVFDFFQKFGK